MGKVPASRVRRGGCRRAKRLGIGMGDWSYERNLQPRFICHVESLMSHWGVTGMEKREREWFGRKTCSQGRRDADLAVRRVAEQLALGVLHGTGDGAVHEPGDSELRHAQFAFQHCVLDQRETGRPGAKMEATASGWVHAALTSCWNYLKYDFWLVKHIFLFVMPIFIVFLLSSATNTHLSILELWAELGILSCSPFLNTN